MVINSLSYCLSEAVFISPSFLKDSFYLSKFSTPFSFQGLRKYLLNIDTFALLMLSHKLSCFFFLLFSPLTIYIQLICLNSQILSSIWSILLMLFIASKLLMLSIASFILFIVFLLQYCCLIISCYSNPSVKIFWYISDLFLCILYKFAEPP